MYEIQIHPNRYKIQSDTIYRYLQADVNSDITPLFPENPVSGSPPCKKNKQRIPLAQGLAMGLLLIMPAIPSYRVLETP
jgi:hypothetical protein